MRAWLWTYRPRLWPLLLVLSMSAYAMGYMWPWMIREVLDTWMHQQTLSLSMMMGFVYSLLWLGRWAMLHYVKTTLFAWALDLTMRWRAQMMLCLYDWPLLHSKAWPEGKVICRCMTDIETFRRFLAQDIVDGTMAALNIMVLTVFMFTLHAKLSLFLFAVLPGTFFLIQRLLPTIRKGFDLMQTAQERMTQHLREWLGGMAMMKAMALKPYFQNRWEKEQDDLRGLSIKQYKLCLNVLDLSEGVSILGVWILLLGGLYFLKQGELSIGGFVAMFWCWSMLMGPFMRLSHGQSSWQEARSAWKRLSEITADAKVMIKGLKKIGTSKAKQGLGISLRQVSFSYDGQQRILDQINWQIAPGEMVALMGMSGSGKTTLLHLISGLYEPSSGQIEHQYLGRSIERQELSSWISVVMQDDFLFSGTIYDNVTVGGDYTHDDIDDALHAACAWEMIQEWPEGLNTVIGERGYRLSGGQRQRIALARALIRRPALLLLDEATCALDALTENKIQERIRKICPHSTIIIVAHRFSTIKDVERVVVIEEGVLVEQGTHESLIKNHGLYHQMYYEQFKD